jgi:translation initiation factor 2 subunit 3
MLICVNIKYEYIHIIMNDTKYNEFIKTTMINQPIINIGMVGHVANGKSTITGDMSGAVTQRHSDERKRNITIRLGYANAKIYKCPTCSSPECFQSTSSSTMEHLCEICFTLCELISHVSFIDSPGHNLLMSTMLNGTCIMDCTILVESCSNEIIPAPQTVEHYMITKKAGIDTNIVCLNKVDLFAKSKDKVQETIDTLRTFLHDNNDDNIPIIPTSGTLKCNMDVLCQYISQLTIPKKDITDNFKMLITRSFNVNNPKTIISELNGGVVGGSLVRGVVNVDDDAYIYPGYIDKNNTNDPRSEWIYTPLKCKILSIKSDSNKLQYAIPGGLIGVQLDVDPGITGDDKLVGQIIFKSNKDSTSVKVFHTIKVKFVQLDKSKNINIDNKLKININSNNINCIVCDIIDDILTIKLEKPICVEINDKITINIPIGGGKGIHIFGHGNVIDGIDCILK